MRLAGAGVAGLLLLAGCASVEPRPGFEDVRGEVSERTGLRVRWESGSGEDAQARAAVRDLLARELTADSAVQVALLNNRDLRAMYEELSIAQADLVRAGLLRNPVFDAALRWPAPGSGYGVDLGVAMGFLDIVWIPARRAIAGAAFERVKLSVSGRILGLAGDVRRAYYESVAAEQRVEMLETVVAAFGASYELAERLHAAGNIRDLDLTAERAAYEEARVELSRAGMAAAAQREALNELMGVWGDQAAWTGAARLPEIAADDLPAGAEAERRAVERSLDLAAARREVEVSARRLGIARPEAVFGDADLGVEAEREIDGAWSVGPGVSVPVPIFDQGRSASLEARAELAAAAERMHALAVRVRARARLLSAAAAEARERAEYYRAVILPLRERMVREMQLQYNAMQVSPLQLLEARRDQARAGGEYVRALRDYWVSRTRLEVLLAGRMVEAGGTADEPVSTEDMGARIGAGEH